MGDEGTLGGLGSARLGKARFTGSTVRRLTGSAVHRFTGSAVRRFTGLAVHRLAGSQVPRLTGSPVGRFSGSMVRRAGSAGSSLRFEPGPREKCPSLPVRTRVRRFGHRFAGSTYFGAALIPLGGIVTSAISPKGATPHPTLIPPISSNTPYTIQIPLL